MVQDNISPNRACRKAFHILKILCEPGTSEDCDIDAYEIIVKKLLPQVFRKKAFHEDKYDEQVRFESTIIERIIGYIKNKKGTVNILRDNFEESNEEDHVCTDSDYGDEICL